MGRRAGRTGAAAALGAAALAAALGAACNLVVGLGNFEFPVADGGTTTCNVDADCDDENPCTDDACGSDKTCAHTPIADGPAPPSAQTTGDCKQVDCEAGEPKESTDATDVPTNDDPCKTAECNGSMPFLGTKDDNTPCMASTPTGEMAGSCEDGVCRIMCDAATPCPDMGPCEVATCDAAQGTCLDQPLPDGTPTPGVTQMAGTCKSNVCIGGVPTDEPDDGNIPAAMNDCQVPTCDNGVPSLPGVMEDQPCSTFMGAEAGFCDGSGSCVQCNEDAECTGTSPSDDCQHPVCTANACTAAFTAAGTATAGDPPQVAGDCHTIRCDGMGGTTNAVDNTDKPASLPCKTGTCNNGVPGQMNDADGTPCGNGLSCNGGTCDGCTMNSQCQGAGMSNAVCVAPNCVCTPSTCAQLGKTCGAFPDNCGGMASCSGAQNGAETDVDCGGAVNACAARCAQGKHCAQNSDCATNFCVDGVCCNNACPGACQACSAAKKGQGSDGVCGAIKSGSDPDGECPAQGAASCGSSGTGCNGAGACIDYANGTICVAASCTSGTATAAKTCNGTGSCDMGGAMTSCAPYVCNPGGTACRVGCGVSDANCAAGYYCSLMTSTCLAKGGPGATCTANDQCLSGMCMASVCQ